ncbi:MAG: hypothetical protein P8J27_03910 [Mariniblastus sp.]|nr:hypothetical protein [Mariniblastus sp.]
MKFRVLDLFSVTTYAAIAFAAFNHDLTTFRQLVFFALVSTVAVIANLLFEKKKWRILGGVLGGSMGGAIYLFISLLFRDQFYDASPWSPQPNILFAQWFLEAKWVVFVAAGTGGAMGPLLTTHLNSLKLPPEAKRDRWISWAILGGISLLLFFKMNDRVSMIHGGRDWSAIIVLLTLSFMVHTIHWNRKLTSLNPCEVLPADPN